jgi:3-oxoacyl-[acyl-carrier-protein] synthase-3
MRELKSVGVLGIGAYAPEKVLTNFDLEKMVDTSDEWIKSRTGIEERRMSEKEESTSDMAFRAAEKALLDANVKAEELDLIIVATMTPDYFTPATAAIIQDRLGAKKAAAFDLSSACSGQVYSLVVGSNFIATGAYKKVLVIGAETLTKFIDFTDRNTCILFGDGASAFVLGEVEEEYGIKSFHLGADGSGEKALLVPAGGSKNPASEETVVDRDHFLKMNGREVFKFAVNVLPETTLKSLEGAGLGVEDIDMVVPHQANYRIVSAAAKKLGMDEDKFYMNLNKYGNTSGASIGLALNEAYENGKVKKGDNLVLVGFGAGLSYASLVLKWSK